MIRRTQDRGAVLPIVAISMIALLVVLALVIDLGFTRGVRASARSAADAGSTAGAVALGGANPSAVAACQDALSYTFIALGTTQPSNGDITSACTGFSTSCVANTARTGTVSFDNSTVTVTHPVPNNNPLMDATSLGSGVPQTVNPATDGAACDRVGVQITRPQGSFFRGIMGATASTYTVHSVAVHINKPGTGDPYPALVALNQSACKAIDSGNGLIYLIGNEKGPGIAFSDSDGPSCTSANPIISAGSSGQVCGQPSLGVVGQLGWYSAPAARGYNTAQSVYTGTDAICGSPPASTNHYAGIMVSRPTRTTRGPIDSKYRCSSVNDADGQPKCAASADPIKGLETLSTGGFAVYTDCSNNNAYTFSTNTVVNCPNFTVQNRVVEITNGATVVFNGSLSVGSNGDLRVNTGTSADASGYPIPSDASKQTTIIINSTAANAFDMQSSAANIRMAQTTVYSKGGMSISGSPTIRWTPPASGPTAGLLYWSESSQQFSLSGSPAIFAKGVFFQGNGRLFVSGGGVIDMTKVQMWVDTVTISGGGGVKLSADPTTGVTTGTAASSLIR